MNCSTRRADPVVEDDTLLYLRDMRFTLVRPGTELGRVDTSPFPDGERYQRITAP
ncbi:MAG: hypothetical protein H7Z43_05740 [Clostridia bacterium]|nr:hypothetical protein [Deltaproteobacteria bacterium]